MKEKNLKRRDGPMGQGWYLDFTFHGKRARAFGGYNLEAARNELARLRLLKLDEVRGLKKPVGDVLFEVHADEFLELYSKQNKRSWARDELSLNHLKDFFRGKLLSEVTSELIEKYKAKRRADIIKPRGKKKKSKPKEPRLISPSTINRELACLKTCLTKAVEWAKLDRSPATKVKKFREANSRERYLTVDEAKRLLAEAGDELRPVLIVALSTGMRKNEILSLRWKDADFVKGFIHISDSKSGQGRNIPMNGLTFETLHAMDRSREFVFENPETRTHVRDVKTGFRAACRRAGIGGLRFHDLRHTAASRMVEAGIDLVTVSKILGHASIQMTMRYSHPTPENMRLAVQKLGEFLGQTRQKVDSVQIPKPLSVSKHDN